MCLAAASGNVDCRTAIRACAVTNLLALLFVIIGAVLLCGNLLVLSIVIKLYSEILKIRHIQRIGVTERAA